MVAPPHRPMSANIQSVRDNLQNLNRAVATAEQYALPRSPATGPKSPGATQRPSTARPNIATSRDVNEFSATSTSTPHGAVAAVPPRHSTPPPPAPPSSMVTLPSHTTGGSTTPRANKQRTDGNSVAKVPAAHGAAAVGYSAAVEPSSMSASPRGHSQYPSASPPPPPQHLPPQGVPSSAGFFGFLEEQLVTMRLHATKIAEHLSAEATARAEADRKLKILIDLKAQEIAAELERRATENLQRLQVHIDGLTKKVDGLERELASEREKNVRLTQEIKFLATHSLEDVKDQLVVERSQRMEGQTSLLHRIAQECHRLQERLDAERHARDQMNHVVRDELQRASRQKEKSEDKVLLKIKDELAALRVALRNETNTRERTEEQLTSTLEEVYAQIQLGLNKIAME